MKIKLIIRNNCGHCLFLPLRNAEIALLQKKESRGAYFLSSTNIKSQTLPVLSYISYEWCSIPLK